MYPRRCSGTGFSAKNYLEIMRKLFLKCLLFAFQVQLYLLDEHERASKEAAATLSQQGEQRQQLRQKLAQQFQMVLMKGGSELELDMIRRELADFSDPDEE